MPTEQVDVLICGSGSAGLCTALWLAKRGLSCKIIEKNDGPLERGKADGVQCRTVEIFQSFGLAEELLRESYHVLEVAFWTPNGTADGIRRSNRCGDTPPGLSHQPHLILNQARINNLFLEEIRKLNGQEVEYGVDVHHVSVDERHVHDHDAYCVSAVVDRNGKEHTYKARYLIGSDGAHSSVRKSLGIRMLGDSSDSVWGVMDIYPLTDFPDIRKKCVIKSTRGSILIIPREGGTLTRFYVELPVGTQAKDVTLKDLVSTVQTILSPYKLRNMECIWWSAYSIGQRLADQFTKFNRIFLTGDACHTHSPKAGQGMNTSLQDGYNLGWKLAAVLRKEAPTTLLETYVTERQQIAHMLINFDREFAKGFSSKSSSINGAEAFTKQFIDSAIFTTGLAAKYPPSMITDMQHSSHPLASGISIGMRLSTTMVVRHCDAKPMQLIESISSNGSWRIIAFGGDITKKQSADRLQKLAQFLDSELTTLFRDITSTNNILIDPLLVLSGNRADIEMEMIPSTFRPPTGRHSIPDPHKVFVDDEGYNAPHGRAYKFYGVDEIKGALAVIRPDQHVSAVFDLEDHAALGRFFTNIFISDAVAATRYGSVTPSRHISPLDSTTADTGRMFSLQAW